MPIEAHKACEVNECGLSRLIPRPNCAGWHFTGEILRKCALHVLVTCARRLFTKAISLYRSGSIKDYEVVHRDGGLYRSHRIINKHRNSKRNAGARMGDYPSQTASFF